MALEREHILLWFIMGKCRHANETSFVHGKMILKQLKLFFKIQHTHAQLDCVFRPHLSDQLLSIVNVYVNVNSTPCITTPGKCGWPIRHGLYHTCIGNYCSFIVSYPLKNRSLNVCVWDSLMQVNLHQLQINITSKLLHSSKLLSA